MHGVVMASTIWEFPVEAMARMSGAVGQSASMRRSVRIWLGLVALLVFAMIVVGGATRLTDSGLSITEWKPILGAVPPLSASDWAEAFEKYKQIPEYTEVNKGMSLEAFKVIFWWEWAHRFLGRFIGVAFALPALYFWWRGAFTAGFQVRMLVLFLLGGLQGFIGWYMVQSGLVDRIDVSQYRLAMHLGLAFIIFAALCWTILDLAPDASRRAMPVSSTVRALAMLLAGLIFLQVIAGAFVAGTKAGLTYNTWPLMDGHLVPDGLWIESPWYLNFFENITLIQFNHRVLAYLIAIGALALVLHSRNGALEAPAWTLLSTVIIQAGIGVWILVSTEGKIPIGLGILHQGFAAVVLTSAIYVLYSIWGAKRRMA